MKILELVFHLGQGGAERFVVDLSNELAKKNEIVLLTLKDDNINPEKMDFYKSEVSDNVQYKCLGLPWGFSIKSQWKVYKAILNENPDIVHLHAATMPYSCLLAILLLFRKYRFFQTIHGDIYAAYTKPLYRFLFGVLGRLGLYRIISLSPKNYSDLQNVYPKIQAICIENGRSPMVCTKEFDNVKKELESYKENSQTTIVVHVGRCYEIKDQRLLITAFNSIAEKGTNAHLFLIGTNYESTLGLSLQELACNKVHFLGAKKNIADYMFNADLFCLSSITEGMPITLIEAMLCRTPMVSTPVCGAVDVIQNGVNGYTSEDHSLAKYQEVLELSIDNVERLKRNTTNIGYDSVFTIKVCAERYLKYFLS